jgi:hypothetical protein
MALVIRIKKIELLGLNGLRYCSNGNGRYLFLGDLAFTQHWTARVPLNRLTASDNTDSAIISNYCAF